MLDTEQFQRYEESIQKTRMKQRNLLNDQLRESLEEFRNKVSRTNYIEKRLSDIEEKLEIRGQQIESLMTTFNTAMFKDDTKSMEEAKASRVEVAAEIEKLENEKAELEQEQEDSEFNAASEGGELVSDVRKAKGMISGDPRARCLDDDIEAAFVQAQNATERARMPSRR